MAVFLKVFLTLRRKSSNLADIIFCSRMHPIIISITVLLVLMFSTSFSAGALQCYTEFSGTIDGYKITYNRTATACSPAVTNCLKMKGKFAYYGDRQSSLEGTVRSCNGGLVPVLPFLLPEIQCVR
jgi:hypothetical protein